MEHGRCFQRRLFVCQCVCPHDNFRTTKRRTNKVGCYIQCTKISPEFEGQGQRSKAKVARDKKRKNAESSPLTMHSRACAVARPYAASSNGRYHCVAARGYWLRRWENQRMLSSLSVFVCQCVCRHDNFRTIKRRTIKLGG